MNKLKLVMHCGGREVTRSELDNRDYHVLPAATRTHTPIPHSMLVDTVTRALSGGGHEVINEAHGLSEDGQRYFGCLQIGNEADTDTGLVIGLRNSHDKKFAAQLALGHGVFVCDNLAFTGEVRIARRHTPNIRRDLAGVTSKAVGRLLEHRQRQDFIISAYKGQGMASWKVNDMLIRSMQNRAIGCQAIPKVLAEWEQPSHEEFKPRTAWSLFNAYTEVLKKGSLLTNIDKTQKLHGVFNACLGISV